MLKINQQIFAQKKKANMDIELQQQNKKNTGLIEPVCVFLSRLSTE